MRDKLLLGMNDNHTQEQLLQYFNYDSETGKLFWKINKNKIKAGDEAKTPHNSGYLSVQVDKTSYLVHRVIWCILYGSFPKYRIDHINLDKTKNTPDNLRIATGSNNCCNQNLRKDNTSGVKGVCWHSRLKKWQARVQINGIRSSKYFNLLDDAEKFIKEKRIFDHKEFANNGEAK